MEWYQKSKEALFSEFKITDNGLSSKKASENLKLYGLNELSEEKQKGFLSVFFSQFKDLLVIILVIAAIISAITDNLESTLVIFAVIILNAILGTVQHFKAEKSLKSLKAMSSPMAKVIRDGNKQVIPSNEVTPGDIILLEAGDLISADGRVIENYSLQVNESSLTGESLSVVKSTDTISGKNIAIGDRINMVFSGSLVTNGRALIVVTDTGMKTEFGKIAGLLNQAKSKKTPLQVSLDKFSKNLSIGIIIICFLVFIMNILRNVSWTQSLMFSVALAVAAIPEALSSIVTISLAIGTSKMAKQNAIMKNLKSVEGLGCVSVICSDKTGTLTQNKMTVVNNFTFEKNCDNLLLSSVLCNDAYLKDGIYYGDPTETALIQYVEQNNALSNDYKNYIRVSELPFDSDRKLMSTVNNIDNKNIIYVKGAIDSLLPKISSISVGDTVKSISNEDIEKIENKNIEYSNNGNRVLAFAYKVTDKVDIDFEDESDLIFIGLIAMIDPPRDESKKAVSDCLKAGIKPIIITGDHKLTAVAIARELGIYKDGDMALTGSEIDSMSDKELTDAIKTISVYARVSPENKIRIVDLWQALGNIVAMTGDGVNDAPALKQADVGIAMGITGTEVSKDAADMVLTDDNFATIIKSVVNGRNIYENIKNSIRFLLSGNIAGLITVLYTSILGLPIPFAAVQLLFINLVTDSLPALAISTEKSTSDLLNQKPRSNNESILTKKFMKAMISEGLLISIFTIISYYIGLSIDGKTAGTMAFATLCLARLWHGFNCRSKGSIFKIGLFTNMYSIGAFLVGTLLLVCIMCISPLQGLFTISVLSMKNAALIAVMSLMPTLLIQIYKIIRDFKYKSM